VVCRTLYTVRLKKHLTTEVERFYSIDYSQFWVNFGISIPTVPPLGSASPSPASKPQQPAASTPSKKSTGATADLDYVDRSQLIMLAALQLQTLFLHMPTMELNKGDAEDSDYEEEVNIN